MSEPEPVILVLTSVGTEQQAVEISEELIARRLATCINIVPCLRSIYRWKGKVCEDTEYLLLIKTPRRLFERVSEAIREFHSYELPEILALPVDPRRACVPRVDPAHGRACRRRATTTARSTTERPAAVHDPSSTSDPQGLRCNLVAREPFREPRGRRARPARARAPGRLFAAEDEYWVVSALREALANAIRHGNRGDPAPHGRWNTALSTGLVHVTVADAGSGIRSGLDSRPDRTAEPAAVRADAGSSTCGSSWTG